MRAAVQSHASYAAAPDRPQSVGALSPPIDLVHLARATDGDESLEAELLSMFAHQSEKLSVRVKLTELPRRARGDIAHRLRGSALAIGAFAVAEAAEAVETAFAADTAGEPWAQMAALDAAVVSARDAIARLTG